MSSRPLTTGRRRAYKAKYTVPNTSAALRAASVTENGSGTA